MQKLKILYVIIMPNFSENEISVKNPKLAPD